MVQAFNLLSKFFKENFIRRIQIPKNVFHTRNSWETINTLFSDAEVLAKLFSYIYIIMTAANVLFCSGKTFK